MPDAPLRRKELTLLALLLAARLALSLSYSATVPLWESDNEDGHFAYARYLAKHRTLLKAGDPEAEKIWEKFQPPLYYLIVAPAIAWLDLGDTFPAPERNPYFVTGRAGFNIALHPPHLQGEAYRIALAVFIGRGVSALISAASVVFVYGAARRFWPTQASLAWAAACLYAFWPQFLFTGSMVTNDALVTSLSAVAFYVFTRLAGEGFRLRLALLLAVTLGADLLAKLNAVALIPVAFIAVGLGLTSHPSHRPARPAYQVWSALVASGLLVLIALQFVGSLKFVTEQVFHSETVRSLITNTASQETLSTLIPPTIRYSFRTFLASFGWGNFEVYRWLYWVWEAAASLALLGLIVSAFRRLPSSLLNPRPRGAIETRLLGKTGLPGRLWPGVLKSASGASRYTTGAQAPPANLLALAILQVLCSVGLTIALAVALKNTLVPGRYLLPALPAVSFLLVTGWQALIPARWCMAVQKFISLGLVLVGWSIPLWSIVPAYARPQPLASDAIIDYRLDASFRGEIELLGYLRPQAVLPGQNFKITLCWRAVVPLARNYSVFLEIVGPDGQGYGRLETYPGRGNYPTSFWTVNERFCDHYAVEAREDAPAPSAARLHVALLDGVNGPALPVSQLAGNRGNAEFAEVPIKIQAANPALPLAHPVRYRFGDGITLKGYDVQALPDARGAKVSLLWEASQDIGEDYTVFVHLRDTPRTAYTQGDGQPRGGWYPTSSWQAGETILDEHFLVFRDHQAPPPLDLYVGLIHAETLVRLLALDERGNRVANNEVILARGLTFPPPP